LRGCEWGLFRQQGVEAPLQELTICPRIAPYPNPGSIAAHPETVVSREIASSNAVLKRKMSGLPTLD
jgi:hypothetical protein